MKMQSLRILTVPRLLAINAVVAGLEIAACVAFTFIPPLLLKVINLFLDFVRHSLKLLFLQAGFTETNMSIILGVAPFLALFTVSNTRIREGVISSKMHKRLKEKRRPIPMKSRIFS